MAFQMPPALAGDNAEVSMDGDGLSNIAMVAGGLAAFGIAAAIGGRAAGAVLGATTGNSSNPVTMTSA